MRGLAWGGLAWLLLVGGFLYGPIAPDLLRGQATPESAWIGGYLVVSLAAPVLLLSGLPRPALLLSLVLALVAVLPPWNLVAYLPAHLMVAAGSRRDARPRSAAPA